MIWTKNGEQVNANLNVHLEIPVVNKAGRGIPFYYVLGFDSSVWSPVTTNGTKVWTQATAWGWSGITSAATGSLTYRVLSHSCYYPPRQQYYYWNDYVGWQYIDPSGTAHAFSLSNVTDFNTSYPCGGDSYPTSKQSTAADNSGYTISESGHTGTVYSPSGDTIFPLSPSNSVSTWIIDPNSNEVSSNSSGSTTTFTDTLGKTALRVTGSGTPSSPIVLSYTAAGGAGSVTMNYITKTVQTSFGCTGISDFGPTQENLVSSVVLQDNETYSFTYETTPGHSGNVTGRLASVTLPTGGTVAYAYSGGNNGIECADGSTPDLTRTVNPGGQWSYARTFVGGSSGSEWKTVLTDPGSNVTTFYFQSVTPSQSTIPSFYETERDLPGGLETVYSCYNGATKPCNTTAVAVPLTRRTVWTTLGSQTSEVDTTFNTYGLSTEVDEYDWGPSLSREIITSYNDSSCGVTNAHVLDRPCSVTIKDAAGSTVASSSFNYNGNGNLLSTTSDGLTLNFTYNSNGTMATSKDAAGNQTSYSYGGNSCGAFPDAVSFPLSLSTSAIWNCDGAVVATSTDENSQQTTFSYDNMNRLKVTTYPASLGTVTNDYSHLSSNPPYVTVTYTNLGSSGGTRTDATYLDGLGRVSSQTVRGVTTHTYYNNVGEVSSVSTDGSGAVENYKYDALGRLADVGAVRAITHADGDGIGITHSGNCTITTDEANKTNEVCSDALGRITRVIDGLGNETDSSYDSLDDLIKVTEGSQIRTYNYDSLGRLTGATTPESGTTNYYYTTTGSGLCSGDPSAVCRRTDARIITTTYAYDALNRLTSKSYNDNPQTPTASYSYDQSSVTIGSWSSGALQYPKGRLTEATTTASGSVQTGLVYSYDQMGRVANLWQCAPYNCGSASIWSMPYTYDLAGDVLSYTNPAGFAVTRGVDDNQRPTSLTYGSNMAVSSITYTPWGAINTICGGNGCGQSQETRQYNNRLQPILMELGTLNTPSSDYSLAYTYTGSPDPPCSAQQGSGDNGNITGATYTDNVNSGYSHTFTYCYDAVNRLTQAVATGSPAYDLIYNYDQYGNVTCAPGSGGGLCPAMDYNSNTNRLTDIGGATINYDAAGNQLNDIWSTYQYDAEGRVTHSSSSGQWQYPTYDAFGQRVQDYQSAGSSDSMKLSYPRDIFGQRTGIWDDHSSVGWVGWDVYWSEVAGQRLNMGGSSAYIDHSDAIGSTVMETDPAGGVQWDTTYYPWGQVWQQGGTRQSAAFAGLDWRVNDPLIPSATRELSPALGRWLTPDPLGGDVTNPQSLNRYAYVLNNPTTLTDPLGLQSGDFDPRACQDPAYADGHAECQGPGSDYCSQFPYSPECSGYPGGGRGTGGVGGGNRPAPPGAPPAGQPPLAGMGNAGFPQGGSLGLPPGCEQLPGGVIWCPPGSVPWQWLIPVGAAGSAVLLIQSQTTGQGLHALQSTPRPSGGWSDYAVCAAGESINQFFGDDEKATQSLAYLLGTAGLAASGNPLVFPVGALALVYYTNGFLRVRRKCEQETGYIPHF